MVLMVALPAVTPKELALVATRAAASLQEW